MTSGVVCVCKYWYDKEERLLRCDKEEVFVFANNGMTKRRGFCDVTKRVWAILNNFFNKIFYLLDI